MPKTEQPEQKSEGQISLHEIRWKYLQGKLPWDEYRELENTLTFSFGADNRTFPSATDMQESVGSK